MPDTLTSTVPGAIGVLSTYLANVATANPSLECGTYVGIPVATVTNNYMMVGNYENGQLIQNYLQTWAGLPAVANRKNEQYEILGTIRTWDGSSSPVNRLTDAFTLLDGVMSQFANDPNGSGAITPSGTWSVGGVELPSSGPFGGKGWGALITFTVTVINVRLTA